MRQLAKTRARQGGRGPSRATSTTIPERQAVRPRRCSTTCATWSASPGFGIGSAGLPAYNLLVEGYSQALDNDVVLSMKQANVPAVSRFVDTEEVDDYFDHEGHRTVVSQRALQVHTDPMLGYTDARRRRVRRVRDVALRGRPRLVRPHRARRDRGRRRPARAGPPPRSTAPPTRTATRTSSTSRSRRRSRPAWRAAARSSSPG